MQRTRRSRRTQRFTRSMTDRVLGGVCGGLADYLGIQAWWVRVAFGVLVAFTLGSSLLLYIALWLAMPEQTLADLEGTSTTIPRRVRPETLILIGGGIIIVGILVLALNVGIFDTTNAEAVLPFAVILLGLTLLAQQLRRPF